MGKLKLILFTVLLSLAGMTHAANVSDYAVKAAYLSSFADFVQWPKNAFPDKNSPVVVGVLGDDPFGKTLDDAAKRKTSDGRALTVKRFSSFENEDLENLKNCQILFIANSEQDSIREILSNLKGSNLLTVSEIEHFPKMGGIIQFNQEGDSIGLILNRKLAIFSGLKLSAQLLKVSKIYSEVNVEKVKILYYDGIQLYVKGDLAEAIKKWKDCLEEDPDYAAAQESIIKARAKLKAISRIK